MTDVSAGFRPPCWCPSRWAPTWRLHTNLYKFGENVSPHIFHKKNCCDLILGESLNISTFFVFPDSGLNLLNGFDFLFWSILNGVTLKTSNYIYFNKLCLWIHKYCSFSFEIIASPFNLCQVRQNLVRVYYSLAVWRFKPILSAGLRFHSHLSGGLRLRNYCAVAGNHKFSSRFSVFACFCGGTYSNS